MLSISKTDYMIWRECPKNAWLRIHKPDVFFASELTDFDKSLIDTGIEVEGVARGLFPDGKLVEGRDVAAQIATGELIAAKTKTLFQPLFERNGVLAAVDVLLADLRGGYAIYEIKSSTKVKEEHLYDVAFQTALLRRCGLRVEEIHVVHLNSEYVRSGPLDVNALFAVINVTGEVGEIIDRVIVEIDEARAYLIADVEPPGLCSCIYKGRSRHCSTFHYSNPGVPPYGVHDIARIGNSPKKLKEMVDAGVFELDKIPKHIKLSEIQEAQVEAYRSGETRILKNEIRIELASLNYPLYFIDYETCPSALPLFDGYSPYEQIPFQYSLHVVASPEMEPSHSEFLHTSPEDPSKRFVNSLQENIGAIGTVIVWNRTFESGINADLARRSPGAEAFIADMNGRIYDLKDIFSKQFYVHRDLWGKVSIKNVLPVFAPELSYSTLEIQDGGAASVAWRKVISGELKPDDANRLGEAMKKYCGTDSFAMYVIWKKLRELATA